MKFFYPQIQLARETHLNDPDSYYLHIVTFCPLTNYRADGYEVDDSDLQTEGVYKVTIKIYQDVNLPDFKYITPLVHTISLGSIAFPGGDGWIEVTVEGAVIEESSSGSARSGENPTTTTKTGGTGAVSTTNADDRPKPIDMDTL